MPKFFNVQTENYIVIYYNNLDRITEKKYNGDNNKRITYSYGSDGNISRMTDYFSGTNIKYVYDLAGRVVSEREYSGTNIGGNTLRGYTNYTYADKTNYLTAMEWFSPLGTQKIGYRYGDMAKGEMPDQIYSVTWNGKEKVKYTYDGLGRLTNKHIGALDNIYAYEDVTGTKTTTLVKSVKTAVGTFTYTYDKIGNIKSVSDGTYTITYDYDNLNQLVRSNDEKAGKTYTYSYKNGNIVSKNEYAYTTGDLGEVLNTTNWTYGDSEWADLLTNFNGEAITYDEIGNPLTIGSKSLTWNGRQLQSLTDGDTNISFAYNGDGQRVSKTVNGTTTEYFYNGGILAGQKSGNEVIYFMYDNNADIFGFIYNGTEYFYVKNAQNDVVAITDSTGKVIANYYYDDWGKLIETTGNTEIANLNPIRYRSYYYDSETGWYYLNTRYYAPEMSRFLNADGYVQTGQGMLDKNMFSYCENNPINRLDINGNSWKDFKNWCSQKWNAVKNFVNNTFGWGGETAVSESQGVQQIIPEPSPVTWKIGTKEKTVLHRRGNTAKPITGTYTYIKNSPINSSASLNLNIKSVSLNLSVGLTNTSLMGSYTNGNTTHSLGLLINPAELKLGFEYQCTVQWDADNSETVYSNASMNGGMMFAIYNFNMYGRYLFPNGNTQSYPNPQPIPAY